MPCHSLNNVQQVLKPKYISDILRTNEDPSQIIQFSLNRISTVGPKCGGPVGIGYVRPDQFLDHLTVIIKDIIIFSLPKTYNFARSLIIRQSTKALVWFNSQSQKMCIVCCFTIFISYFKCENLEEFSKMPAYHRNKT